MEQWNNLIGKDLIIIFEDGENHFSKRMGILIGVSETHLFLETEFKQEGILLAKVIRFEVKQ